MSSMRATTSIALFALLAPLVLTGQDADPQTRPLAAADKRAIPATPAELRKLVAALESDRAELDTLQRENPVPGRSRTIQLLEEEIESLKRLDARRQEMTAESDRLARASTQVEEVRKRLAQAGQDEEPLADPADPEAEVSLGRDRESTDELMREELKRRDDAAQAREKLRLEQERVLRRLPGAKRDLNEAQADLSDYETDSREAVSGGLGGEQARAMLEQVYLYRLRVAEQKTTVEALKYQAGEVSDLLIDKASLDLAFAEEKLQRLEARRRKIDTLAEKAAASRVERGRAEVDLLAKTAATAAPWARPFWEQKQKLAAMNVTSADLARSKRAVETSIGPGGEIAALRDEGVEESARFARVDAEKADLADVVPGTTRGLLAFIAHREEELERLRVLHDDLRGMRKDLRELQRSARSDDPAALAEKIEAARAAGVPAERVDFDNPADREAANPSSWDKLAASLKAAASTRSKLIGDYDQVLASAQEAAREARNTREQNLLRYRSALLWTRDVSEISFDAVDRARGDLALIPETIAKAASGAAVSSVGFARDAAREGRVLDLLKVFGSLLVLCGLVWVVHRRASRIYVAPPGPAEGTLQSAGRIGATMLRNVEWAALLAFAGVALPAIAGASRRTIMICAAIFTPPLVYRLATTTLDLLFGAGAGARGLLRLPEPAARLFRTTGVFVLRVCACFVPLAFLLTVTGYRDRNPGVVELLWLLNSISCFVVVLVVLLRPSGIAALLRRRGGLPDRATFLRGFLAAAYPAAVLAIIFLLVLRSLSYRVAVRYFLERFAISAAWILGAFLIYRWLARMLFRNEPRVKSPSQDLASDREAFEAQGRRALWDRLRRLVVVFAVFAPATFFVLDAWDLTGAGWDAVFRKQLRFISENLTLGAVVSATITAILAVFVVRSARDLLRFVLLPKTSLDLGVRYTIVTLTTYALVAVSAVVILGGQLKVDPAVIGGFVAALGLGLGFGLQEIINNFFSGLILLVERPLKVGDTISVSGAVGRVDRINMRSTTIMTAENTGVIIPNKDLISSTVTNWSAGTPTIRESVPLGIAYGSDTALFRKLVLDAVGAHGLILKQPGPDLVFVGFGPSSLDFSLRFWIRLVSSGSKVKSDLYFALEASFREHGIEMPFPTHDVHVKSWTAKGPAPTGFEADDAREKGLEAGASGHP